MLMFAESVSSSLASYGSHALRPAHATLYLGVLAARHAKSVNTLFVDGHTRQEKTNVVTAPPHVPLDNPYKSEPFNDPITWKGE
jgi:prepilin-type processing-associated H-X9-DG protein